MRGIKSAALTCRYRVTGRGGSRAGKRSDEMAFLRLIAGALLLVATIAFVDDATRMQLSKKPFQSTSIHEHWQRLSPTSLKRFEASITRTAGTGGLGSLLRAPLALPTWGGFLGLGLLIGFLARRRRRPRTYAN